MQKTPPSVNCNPCVLSDPYCDLSAVCHQLWPASWLGNWYSKEWFRDYLTSHCLTLSTIPILSQQNGRAGKTQFSWPTSEPNSEGCMLFISNKSQMDAESTLWEALTFWNDTRVLPPAHVEFSSHDLGPWMSPGASMGKTVFWRGLHSFCCYLSIMEKCPQIWGFRSIDPLTVNWWTAGSWQEFCKASCFFYYFV